MTPDRPLRTETRVLPWLVIGSAAVLTFGHVSWYAATPLGLAPVLDGKEILQIAQAMAEGNLRAEPFYRAPLYPAFLAVLLKAGLEPSLLPLAAQLSNCVFHLLSAWLVYRIARKTFGGGPGAWVSAALYGLYPVAMHFAGDPLDITPAITLMLAGVWFAVRAGGRRDTFLAGLLLASSAMARPHFWTLAWVWPLWVLAAASEERGRAFAVALIGPVAVSLLAGLINWQIGGQFQILPTQGPYNFWVATKPGANGRYFRQSVQLLRTDRHENPTRLEAERLYLEEGADEPPVDVREMNRHWRSKAIGTILDDPWRWLQLMGRKTLYLINNYEQYNNKTYHLHKDRSPWLRHNPLCWGFLLCLAGVSLAAHWHRREVRLIAVLSGAYAAGVLLYFASARFRLPLVPLLAVLAGGIVQAGARVAAGERKPASLVVPAVFGVLLACASFPAWLDARDPSTVVNDHLLLAKAALEVGRDDEGLAFSEKVLRQNPNVLAAKETAMVSYYNLLASGRATGGETRLRRELELSLGLIDETESAPFIAGVYCWRLGRGDEAVRQWRRVIRERRRNWQQALAALLMTDSASAQERAHARSIPLVEKEDMLLMAEWSSGDEAAGESFERFGPAGDALERLRLLEELFSPRHSEERPASKSQPLKGR